MTSNLVNSSQVGSDEGTITSTLFSDNNFIDFPNSIVSSDSGNKPSVCITGNNIQIISSNGGTTFAGPVPLNHPNTTWISTPHVEVHLNPAFDDDEGIAESGL